MGSTDRADLKDHVRTLATVRETVMPIVSWYFTVARGPAHQALQALRCSEWVGLEVSCG